MLPPVGMVLWDYHELSSKSLTWLAEKHKLHITNAGFPAIFDYQMLSSMIADIT